MNQANFSTVFLPTVEEFLQFAKIPYTREEFAIATSHPSSGAVVKIVSAENILQPRRFLSDVQQIADEMANAIFAEESDVTPLMLIVGNFDFFSTQGMASQRQTIERKNFGYSGPTKRVVSYEEIIGHITALFNSNGNEALEGTPAEVRVLNHSSSDDATPASVTQLFEPDRILNRFEKDPTGGLSYSQQQKASRLFTTVMGSTCNLHWTPEGPRTIMTGVYPLTTMEQGNPRERAVVAFAVYLAELESVAKPGMRLGLYNAFRYCFKYEAEAVLAFLGEFIAATGVSAVISIEGGVNREAVEAGLFPYAKKGVLCIR